MMKGLHDFALTPEEYSIASDAGWIYHKLRITEKVYGLFGRLHEILAAHPLTAMFPFPGNCLAQGAKISKGERYRDLPYVILDYPRYFSNDNIFAIRTLFWWGQFFSITLHISGDEKIKYEKRLLQAREALAAEGFHVCVNNNPWEHNFEEDNYLPVAGLDVQVWENNILGRPFVKFAKRYELDVWENLLPGAEKDYATLLGLLDEADRLSVADTVE
ncbi:hypothetical protein [uncultured Chitinophaga sp.]|uniref:hypothetical protein n=1 Tax=uncultured Chitinophaga sp. TaxID=339340 RepID=UPI0025F4C47E|nr:hypothetical protein [uncultured Chitinophaga sp.]